jgi:hypothetical protein
MERESKAGTRTSTGPLLRTCEIVMKAMQKEAASNAASQPPRNDQPLALPPAGQ